MISGLLGRAGGFGLGVDDALDGGEHALADALVKGADVELEDCLVGDDVLLGSGLQGADGDDGGVGRGDLTGDDGLQT